MSLVLAGAGKVVIASGTYCFLGTETDKGGACPSARSATLEGDVRVKLGLNGLNGLNVAPEHY